MFNKTRKIISVIGKTGYGKSYFVKSFAMNINRIVIFDTQNEYGVEDPNDESFQHDFNKYYLKNFTMVYSLEDFIEVLKESDYDKDLKIILKYDNIESYEDSLEACYLIGSMTVLLEEMHNYASSRDIHPILNQMIRVGRHRDISLIGVSQRFADLNLIYRNNLDAVVAFNLSAPNDIEYLEKIGYIEKQANDLPHLKKYEYKIFLNSD